MRETGRAQVQMLQGMVRLLRRVKRRQGGQETKNLGQMLGPCSVACVHISVCLCVVCVCCEREKAQQMEARLWQSNGKAGDLVHRSVRACCVVLLLCVVSCCIVLYCVAPGEFWSRVCHILCLLGARLGEGGEAGSVLEAWRGRATTTAAAATTTALAAPTATTALATPTATTTTTTTAATTTTTVVVKATTVAGHVVAKVQVLPGSGALLLVAGLLLLLLLGSHDKLLLLVARDEDGGHLHVLVVVDLGHGWLGTDRLLGAEVV